MILDHYDERAISMTLMITRWMKKVRLKSKLKVPVIAMVRMSSAPPPNEIESPFLVASVMMVSKNSQSLPKDINRRSSRRMSSGKNIKYSEMVCSEDDSSHHDSSSHEEDSGVAPPKVKAPPRQSKKSPKVVASKAPIAKSPVPKSTPKKILKSIPSSPVILLDEEDDDFTSNSQPKKLKKRRQEVDDDEDDDVEFPLPTPTASVTARSSSLRNSQRNKSQVNYIELSSDDSLEEKSDREKNGRKRKRVVKNSRRRTDNEDEETEWSE